MEIGWPGVLTSHINKFPLTSPEQHKFPLGLIYAAVVSNLCPSKIDVLVRSAKSLTTTTLEMEYTKCVEEEWNLEDLPLSVAANGA